MNSGEEKSQRIIFVAWFIAIISTLGSLFFSEVMEFPPCALCWYQRIGMYPLVFIFFIGSRRGAGETIAFSTPLVVLGWFIALYHNLLHYEIVPETASPCIEGVLCSTVYIDWFGFLTIPMLSFIAFSGLGVLLYILRKQKVE